MTDERMALLELVEKQVDGDLVREMRAFAAGRIMEKEVEAQRTVTRHVWADARERVDAHRLTDWGKRLYARHKETVERSFADAKPLFGHRYARYRGLVDVTWQALLAATAQNIKKIAMMTIPSHHPAPGQGGKYGGEPILVTPAPQKKTPPKRRGLSVV